ncbi:MAG: ABC transporter permease [Actinomycetota bacterium]|nr:ABC transporter permease [Actinomycetota bacterium]
MLAPHDPRAIAGDALERPSADHLLGTNDVGQDIFSGLLWGARSSLVVAVVAAGMTVLLATIIGAGAGLIGGWVDKVVARGLDVVLAFPGVPLIVLVAALAGTSRLAVILVVGLIGWPPLARLLRSQVLSLRQRGFVRAARGFGGGPGHVLRRHLVPALGPLLVAGFVEWAATAVFLEAGLAFLGLGDPTAVSWGNILNRALALPGLYFTGMWTWLVLPAGLAITVVVVGLTFIGVGLEPIFNRRWDRR